ncbi:LuxR C-terminal-related transcriptional regulator [Cupriavidus pauculus]|uniref:helix-turn-helix transcriptional regulator n=1 Tax=Cupriavidus pauculus TaxID=82633 RepID=UPI001EE2197A|nr:LuxR C-terminal-related transcriptional regulator [Cupriavidus pauculus]GJG94779.1 response regulator transcription factor [Cupriavidus pauculus]
MRAAVVESRPLIGLGIQQVLHRIGDIDDCRAMTPRLARGTSLAGIDLLIVGELLHGYDAAMLQLLGTASAVRGVLYLSAGGIVQWMPPREIAPLLSWLPENATLEAIEQTLRKMIAALRSGCCSGSPMERAALRIADDPKWMDCDAMTTAVPIAVPRTIGLTLPDCVSEARQLSLTQRQYDVLVLLSMGLSIKLISRRLHISIPTVKSHTLQVYRRLSARNKTEAVFMAREKGAMLAGTSAAAEAA